MVLCHFQRHDQWARCEWNVFEVVQHFTSDTVDVLPERDRADPRLEDIDPIAVLPEGVIRPIVADGGTFAGFLRDHHIDVGRYRDRVQKSNAWA